MRIRAAEEADLPACAALFAAVAAETFGWRDASDMSEAAFLRDAEYEDVFVAEDRGRLLGLLALYPPDAFVHSLFVAERGRGVGAALLRHVQAFTGRPLSLKVETANSRAVAFYVREGFWPVESGRDERGPWIRMSR